MAEEILFKPGERVPKTGLYWVLHDKHRPAHEATLLEGESFPACAHCGESVSFSLRHSALEINKDHDFKARKARSHGLGKH